MAKITEFVSVVDIAALLLLSSLVGCTADNATTKEASFDVAGPNAERGEDAAQPSSSVASEQRLKLREGGRKRLPERASHEVQPKVTGEVPEEIIAALRARLATRLGVPAKELEVVNAQSLVWPDGSLGCAQPGQVYTQALVPGYHVVLSHLDRHYDYRTSETGYSFLCQKTFHPGR